MSDQLRIASALRRSNDEALQQLLRQRMLASSNLRDFFDFADAVAAPKSVAAAISGLPKSQADALVALVDGDTANSKALDELCALMLIEKTEKKYSPFDCTLVALAQMKRRPAAIAVAEVADVDFAAIDRDAAVSVFETIQGLTELLFDLEQRFVREVGKRSVGLPDIKRLANHLSKTNDYARELFDLATWTGIIALGSGRWQLGTTAENWVVWTDKERWIHLAKTWREILGDGSALELAKLVGSQRSSLVGGLADSYPFADNSVTSRIDKLVTMANLVGLCSQGMPTSWFVDTLTSKFDKAAAAVIAKLPAAQERIIVQADLTLIAPGPLPTQTEILLRRFADTEQISLASTYRLSALSISHGLETGLLESEIRETLERMSGKALPQPVDYLIRETASRFGRLTVTASDIAGHSKVSSSDSILLTEILNESKLKPFSFHTVDGEHLLSRFDEQMVYFGLREAGFVVIRVDRHGKVISPRQPLDLDETKPAISTIVQDIQRLREQDARVGSDPDDDDITRQIQLAIKNKAKITLTARGGNDAEVTYLLEPIGIANGRLRAKDRKADIERTLPLASIIKVDLG